MDFVGRERELGLLDAHLDRVTRTGEGTFLAVRGRRQVGKSRLLEEFARRAGHPAVFYAASAGLPPGRALAEFTATVAASPLGAATRFRGVDYRDWGEALRALAEGTDRPSVCIVDELPYLLAGDAALEGLLQTAWDRSLSRCPLLLVALGSDLSLMEALGTYGPPLYGRVRELVLDPLTLADTAALLRLAPEAAVDAHLVTGGFPRIAAEWEPGATLATFLRAQLADSTAPLVVVGERVLAAEFPPGLQARPVLAEVGAGEASFSRLGDRLGLPAASLARTLRALEREKRVVAVDRPLSARASRLTHYRVADTYLRFWLRFLGPQIEALLRGRGAEVAEQILAGWPAYRGRAVEPLVRASLERLVPDDRFGAARHVGAFWDRTGSVEVDLVGAVEDTAPADIAFIGSVKWRESAPFDRRDVAALAAQRARVPGAEQARLVAVARSGFAREAPADGLDVGLGPADLLAAWTPR